MLKNNMTEPKKIWFYLIILSFILFLPVGCRKKPAAEPDEQKTATPALDQQPTNETDPKTSRTYNADKIPQSKEISSALSEMKQLGAQWQPIFQAWWTKQAPDFTVTDIEGNTHKLSSSIGKEVLIVKWATYDPGCQKQIANLKELRSIIKNEKLQILAISDETIETVRSFTTDKDLNFPIIAGRTRMPEPYSSTRYLPTSFFIDKTGLVKLAAQGVIPPQDSKKLIETP